MTQDDEAAKEEAARRWALLKRSLLSGFAGAVLGMAMTAQTRGIYLGILIGVAAQLLIRGLVRLVCGDNQDTITGIVTATLAGLAVGGAVGWIGDPNMLLMLTLVGGAVGVVDSVVTWVLFPSQKPSSGTSEEEASEALDTDLHDNFTDNGDWDE